MDTDITVLRITADITVHKMSDDITVPIWLLILQLLKSQLIPLVSKMFDDITVPEMTADITVAKITVDTTVPKMFDDITVPEMTVDSRDPKVSVDITVTKISDDSAVPKMAVDISVPKLASSITVLKTATDITVDASSYYKLALLSYHQHHHDLTDFQYLCSYLKLNVINSTVIQPTKLTSAAMCVRWIVDEPHTLTRAWCTDLINFVNNHSTDGKSLLMVNTRWFSLHLISLPNQYYKIFQAYRKKTCPVCSNLPKDPCICLICGVFLCFRESCCRQQHLFECVQHSIECGAGTGIFLLVNSSIIVVIRGPRAALWDSVYLDEHGEEDRDLKRGKPLYLSKERFSLLESQWISHSFDHACKRWIWHQDRL